jgi:nucleoside-diphosphate-sugar epimerase
LNKLRKERLNMTDHVLVTGASGFIGRHVVNALLAEGSHVLAFDRLGHAPEGAEPFMGDIRDANAVTEAMAHVQGWIHLAGTLGTQETIANPRPAAETNVIGGLNVLQAAAQYNVPGVNIAVGNHWMDNTYSITKTTVERFCNMFRTEQKLPVTVVRAMNAYGPGQVPAAPYGPSKVRKIIPAFVCRALNGDPVEVYGDGSQVMDMVYVEDVARTLVTALRYTKQNGGIVTPIQCGTGRDTTVKEIAQAVIDAVGDGELAYLPMRPGEPEHSVVLADPSTMNVLGINVEDFMPLEYGVEKAVEYFRNIL